MLFIGSISLFFAVITFLGFKLLKRNKENELQSFVIESAKIYEDFSKELIKKQSQISEVVNSERDRIGQYLHDRIQNSLYGIRMKIEQSVIVKDIDSINEYSIELQNVEHEIRGLSHIIHDSITIGNDFISLINEYLINNVLPSTEYELELDPDIEFDILPENIKAILYKTILEAVLNINKHSKAENFAIDIGCNKDKLYMAIQDDGEGLPKKIKYGLGIKTIKQGLEKMEGELILKNGPNKGVILKLSVPFKP